MLDCETVDKKARTRKDSVLNIIFYIGFALISVSKMIERSAIIPSTSLLLNSINVVVIVLFLIKFVFTKHSLREFLISTTCIALLLFLSLACGLSISIFIACCAFVAIKGASIKTVLKIDLIVKTVFLSMHLLVFLLDYVFEVEGVFDFIKEMNKGLAVSLYFLNPNSTGLIGTWIAIEASLLSRHSDWKKFIIPTMIALLTFLITTSRTPFYVYIVYLGLQCIKNANLLTVIQKIMYPILCILSLVMVSILVPGTPIYDALNTMLSSRIGLSIMIYNIGGISFLPDSGVAAILNEYPIDVFYVRCFAAYGIITMFLAYLPHLIMPRNSSLDAKRISVITSLYLFFEAALINVGFAPAYLIIADSILNNKKENMDRSIR